MRIDRRPHRASSGFDVAQERQQPRPIVALRKSLLLHQPFALQHRFRIEKAIGCHQIDFGPRRPSCEQRLQDARGGRLTHRSRAGDTDDVRHFAVADAEKLALRVIKPLRGIDIDRQQARERQIDFLDLLEVEAVMHRTQLREFAGLQRHRRVVAQLGPLLSRKDAVRIISLVGSADIHVAVSQILRAHTRGELIRRDDACQPR